MNERKIKTGDKEQTKENASLSSSPFDYKREESPLSNKKESKPSGRIGVSGAHHIK